LHQRQLLAMPLARVEADEADIAALDRQIKQRLVPYAVQLELLMTIPGIDWVVAATVIAEIGVGHVGVSQPSSSCGLERHLPGQQRKRRKAQTQRGAQGQPLSEDGLVQRRLAQRGCFYPAGRSGLDLRRDRDALLQSAGIR
jgi:transposase